METADDLDKSVDFVADFVAFDGAWRAVVNVGESKGNMANRFQYLTVSVIAAVGVVGTLFLASQVVIDFATKENVKDAVSAAVLMVLTVACKDLIHWSFSHLLPTVEVQSLLESKLVMQILVNSKALL